MKNLRVLEATPLYDPGTDAENLTTENTEDFAGSTEVPATP